MFSSPIANSNRVPAGQLLQGCWETLREDGIPIRIGPKNGFVITHRQTLVSAFAGAKARQFGVDAPFGGQYPQDNFPSGYSNRNGGN